MSGRLVEAWEYTWAELWEPLGNHDDAGASFFMDIFPLLARALGPFRQPLQNESQQQWDEAKNLHDQRLVAASTDSTIAAATMQAWTAASFAGDAVLARALESVAKFLEDPDFPSLGELYFELTSGFLRCHNIRYRLLKPYSLRPHLSGWFSGLLAQVENMVVKDRNLRKLLGHFEKALEQAARSHEDADIGVCIHKAAILAEGIASRHPQAKGDDFGKYCDSVGCWPHSEMKDAFKKVYNFCSGYSGIRHAASPKKMLREDLNTRDGIVAALVLLSSAGYFVPGLDLAEIVG